MTIAVIILASLLSATGLGFAYCVRVFMGAPGKRSLTTVSFGNATEVWVWRPWRGWRLHYRVTLDTSHLDYTGIYQTETTACVW